MKEKKKVFTLYEYDNFKKDYKNIMDYYNLKDLLADNKQIKLKNKNSVYHSITNSLDNIKQLLNDKYIIIKEDY